MLASSTIQMYKFGQKIKNHSTPSLMEQISECDNKIQQKKLDKLSKKKVSEKKV